MTVTGTCGIVTSFSANVSVFENTAITTRPLSVNVCRGQSAQLQTAASGTSNSFQWFLNVNPVYGTNVQAEIYSGETYTIGGNSFTQSGTYNLALTTIFGCDSLVEVNLNVLAPITGNIQARICGGNSLQFGSQNLTQSGTYVEVFPSVSGCDSTVTLQLTVIQPGAVFAVSASVCSGETYLFGNQALTQSGVYSQNFTSIAGCDSLVELTLTVQNPINTNVTLNGNTLTADLAGASYQWIDCNAGNAPVFGATSASFSPAQSGTYAVIITTGSCSDTSACTTVSLPGDLGPETNPGISMNIFPNPTDAFVNIVSSLEMKEIRIYNTSGQLVQTHTAPGMNATVDLTVLTNGVYYLQVSGSLFSHTERIVLSR